jgi:hypothetical protein
MGKGAQGKSLQDVLFLVGRYVSKGQRKGGFKTKAGFFPANPAPLIGK